MPHCAVLRPQAAYQLLSLYSALIPSLKAASLRSCPTWVVASAAAIASARNSAASVPSARPSGTLMNKDISRANSGGHSIGVSAIRGSQTGGRMGAEGGERQADATNSQHIPASPFDAPAAFQAAAAAGEELRTRSSSMGEGLATLDTVIIHDSHTTGRGSGGGGLGWLLRYGAGGGEGLGTDTQGTQDGGTGMGDQGGSLLVDARDVVASGEIRAWELFGAWAHSDKHMQVSLWWCSCESPSF